MQIARLFETVYILLDRDRVTAGELSRHFEVSQRTIYRDVETLCEAGIPIDIRKGKGGGISLMPGFVLDRTVLTGTEKSEMLSVLRGIQTAGGNNADEGGATSALSRLGALFGENNPNWFEIDFSGWKRNAKIKALFADLKNAVLKKCLISFTYDNAAGITSPRSVEPLRLAFKGQDWYLYGFCRTRNECRFFKLSRITNLVLRSETFTRTAPREIFSGKDGYRAPRMMPVEIRIDGGKTYRIRDEFPESCASKNADGSFTVNIELPDDDWLTGWLLSYGEHLEVLAPESLREKMAEILEKTRKKYII